MSSKVLNNKDRLVSVRMPEVLFKAMEKASGADERNAGGFIRRAIAFMAYDKIVEIDPAVPDRIPFVEQHIEALQGIVTWGEKILNGHRVALAKLIDERKKALSDG